MVHANIAVIQSKSSFYARIILNTIFSLLSLEFCFYDDDDCLEVISSEVVAD